MMEIFNWSTQGWSRQRSDIWMDTKKKSNTCRYENRILGQWISRIRRNLINILQMKAKWPLART